MSFEGKTGTGPLAIRIAGIGGRFTRAPQCGSPVLLTFYGAPSSHRIEVFVRRVRPQPTLSKQRNSHIIYLRCSKDSASIAGAGFRSA